MVHCVLQEHPSSVTVHSTKFWRPSTALIILATLILEAVCANIYPPCTPCKEIKYPDLERELSTFESNSWEILYCSEISFAGTTAPLRPAICCIAMRPYSTRLDNLSMGEKGEIFKQDFFSRISNCKNTTKLVGFPNEKL